MTNRARVVVLATTTLAVLRRHTVARGSFIGVPIAPIAGAFQHPFFVGTTPHRRIAAFGDVNLPATTTTTTNRFMSTMATGAASNPPLIDVDCNLWHKDLVSLLPSKDGEETDERPSVPWDILLEDGVADANIVAVLSPSSTIQEAKLGLTALKKSADPNDVTSGAPKPPVEIRTTVGVHPYHVNDDEIKAGGNSDLTVDDHVGTEMREMLTHPENKPWCAAVGECGLDASEGFPPLEDQIPWFQRQVKLAEELKLPLFVHERLAFDETMEVLKDATVPVIIHCFTGTAAQCTKYIDRGYHISVSGYILKGNAENCDEVRSCLSGGIIPLDRLMIETDAPYMGFANCRQRYVAHNEERISATLNSKKKKRLAQSMYPNVPTSLVMVLDEVTELLQQHDSSLTRDQIATATTNNAKKFFGFKYDPQ